MTHPATTLSVQLMHLAMKLADDDLHKAHVLLTMAAGSTSLLITPDFNLHVDTVKTSKAACHTLLIEAGEAGL